MDCSCERQKVWSETGYKPTKYRKIKVMSFTIDQSKQDCMITTWKSIQDTKKNLLLQKIKSITKKLYIDKLDEKADKNNNTYYRTTKINPDNVKLRT